MPFFRAQWHTAYPLFPHTTQEEEEERRMKIETRKVGKKGLLQRRKKEEKAGMAHSSYLQLHLKGALREKTSKAKKPWVLKLTNNNK